MNGLRTLYLALLIGVASPVSTAVIPVQGECTLIAAIHAANNDDDSGGLCPPGGSGADTLVLTSDVALDAVDNSQFGPTGLPVVTSEITIEGGGFAIAREKGAPEFRIFSTYGNLVLESTTIANGSATAEEPGDRGGGVYNRGDLTLTDSTISGSSAANSGGGVFNNGFGDVVLTNSTLSGNSAGDTGGGIYSTFYYTSLSLVDSHVIGNSASRGGGVAVASCIPYGAPRRETLAVLGRSVVRGTVSGNTANIGGGVSVSSCGITLSGTIVSSNRAYVRGGGIANHAYLTVRDSTISHNVADGDGGGVWSGIYASTSLTNTTVSNNQAGEEGGGIDARPYPGFFYTYEVYVIHSTIAGNSAPTGGGVYGSPDLIFENTLVAASAAGGNCAGSRSDDGGNFSDDASCGAGFGVLSAVDDVDLDHDLAANGGRTLTHALPPGSMAIDAGGECELANDQRGAPRDDGACDSGAYEHQSCDEFTLAGPSQVTVGEPFELTLSCATPNSLMRIIAGRDDKGSHRIMPGCGLVVFDIGPRPNDFGFSTASSLGEAISEQNLGVPFGGETIYYQAVDNSACRLSGVLAIEVLPQ